MGVPHHVKRSDLFVYQIQSSRLLHNPIQIQQNKEISRRSEQRVRSQEDQDSQEA